MDTRKKAKLKAMGGRITTAEEFLELTPAEAAMVELRVELATALRDKRAKAEMTQGQLGKSIGTSQAQIARIENASPKVSLDLAVKALLAVAPKGIEMKIGGRGKARVRAA